MVELDSKLLPIEAVGSLGNETECGEGGKPYFLRNDSIRSEAADLDGALALDGCI